MLPKVNVIPVRKLETIKEAYWRLGQPMDGTIIEICSAVDGSWSRARFVMLPEDGVVLVKWLQSNAVVRIPSNDVRRLGEGDKAGDHKLSLRDYLREARRDWTQRDLINVEQKLDDIGIRGALELFRETQDDAFGHHEGVNARLRASGRKTLTSKTLLALRSSGERLLIRDGPLDLQLQHQQQPQQITQHPSLQLPQQVQLPPQPLQQSQLPERSSEATAVGVPLLPCSQSMEGCCLQGHVLELASAPCSMGCNGCGIEVSEGSDMWCCCICDYALCACCRWPEAEALPQVPMAVTDASQNKGSNTVVRCPRGHALVYMQPVRPTGCSYCDEGLTIVSFTWCCALCDYNLCDVCQMKKSVD